MFLHCSLFPHHLLNCMLNKLIYQLQWECNVTLCCLYWHKCPHVTNLQPISVAHSRHVLLLGGEAVSRRFTSSSACAQWTDSSPATHRDPAHLQWEPCNRQQNQCRAEFHSQTLVQCPALSQAAFLTLLQRLILSKSRGQRSSKVLWMSVHINVNGYKCARWSLFKNHFNPMCRDAAEVADPAGEL